MKGDKRKIEGVDGAEEDVIFQWGGVVVPEEEYNKLEANRLQRRKDKKERKKEEKQAKKLKQGEGDSIPQGGSKSKLLIFDLNKVLIYRRTFEHFDVRPFMYEFLNHFGEIYDIALWTSATKSTRKRICDYLFPGLEQSHFKFLWDQRHCDIQDIKKVDNELDYSSDETKGAGNGSGDGREKNGERDSLGFAYASTKPLITKPLSKVHLEFPQYLDNTLIVDDTAEKCLMNPESSRIHPPPFLGDRNDAVLQPHGQLWNRLEELAKLDSFAMNAVVIEEDAGDKNEKKKRKKKEKEKASKKEKEKANKKRRKG